MRRLNGMKEAFKKNETKLFESPRRSTGITSEVIINVFSDPACSRA